MSFLSSNVALTQNLTQEIAVLKNHYEAAIKDDRSFSEVNEILIKIRELEKELARLKGQTSF